MQTLKKLRNVPMLFLLIPATGRESFRPAELSRPTWQLVWFAGESAEPGCLNKRAECGSSCATSLKEGGAIPPDTGLYNDLIGPETVGRVDGKIQLESKADMKKRGLRSPNRADALALSFAYPVSARGPRPGKTGPVPDRISSARTFAQP